MPRAPPAEACWSSPRILARRAPFWRLGAERDLVLVAVDGAALGELLLSQAALVGAGAAPQVLDAEGAEQVGRADGLAAAAEDLQGAADHAGGAGGERVRQGGDS